MAHLSDQALADAVRAQALPLTGARDDHDPLLARIGDAHFVLLGEASHGTHDFYQARARITQRLIQEKGFTAVAIEGDWPDAHRINRYVRGLGEDTSADEALAGFQRFPTWMWRNTDMVAFVDWLRAWNTDRPADRRTGLYGLDLYSLQTSIGAVLAYLDQHDPAAAARARERYACFDQFDHDSHHYGMLAGLGAEPSCEAEVLQQLVDLQRHAARAVRTGSLIDADEAFHAAQNAFLVKNAEQYYRLMYRSNVSSWNLRDQHMMATLTALVEHQQQQGREPRVVVWAHNSHLGDARATEMGQRRRELNIGQLVREKYGRDAVLVGFTTHHGTVTAASDWDAPAECKAVVPALPGSYEAIFHDTGLGDFLLPLPADARHTATLRDSRLERAIGVIYRPATERQSHYFFARLPDQFDAILHYDASTAVVPLEPTGQWHGGEPAETFPTGM